MPHRHTHRLLLFLVLLAGTAGARDVHITLPIPEIERMLSRDPVQIAVPRDIRFKGDAAKRAMLTRDDGRIMRVKMKRAPQGGGAFNNQPRYEIAAYRIQQLFLDSSEYVVPPTAARAIPLAIYDGIEPHVNPTFSGTRDVVCAMSYWLNAVTVAEIYDAARLAADSAYARHVGNLNIFTYLIRHSDTNVGNFLVSNDSTSARVFAVDNGIAFGEIMSERGYEWRFMRVERLPRATVARLRAITRADLDRTLGVVAQFEIRDERLHPVAPGDNLDPERGIHHSGDIVQFGLTREEIDGVAERLADLLKRIDAGEFTLF